MADYDVFREQLAIKYPSYGHALWQPSPWKPDRPVEVGDVSFIRNGRFHSLFNVLRPAEGQPNVPEYHEQLCPEVSDHISSSSLSSSHYCSAGIGVPEQDFHASSPGDFRQFSFRHPGRRGGAVLSLPVKARREDTLAKGEFGAWIVKHIDLWFAFARGLGLGIENMEELILVTGCDRTKSWTNVAFPGNDPEYNPQATFGVKVDHDPTVNIEWQSSPEHVQGAVLHQGPDGTNLPEDQCVFIRGFRVAPSRTFRILPGQLKAVTDPSLDLDTGYDFEPDFEVASIPATPEYRDPLYILLDYIAERAPDCDLFLIHDDALKSINGIGDDTSLEALQRDTVIDLLRRSNTEIHAVQCDLSHIKSNPKPNTEVVRVAMLSVQNWSIAPQSQLSPAAAQRSTGLLHAIESPALPPQTLPDSLPVPAMQRDANLGLGDPLCRLEHATEHVVDPSFRLARNLRGRFAHVQPVSVIIFACAFAFTWGIYYRNVFAFTILLTINVLYIWVVSCYLRKSRDSLRQGQGRMRHRIRGRREAPRRYVMSNLAVPVPVEDAQNGLV